MGLGTAKQFRPIGGRSVLAWSLAPLLACARVRRIVVVIARDLDPPMLDLAPADRARVVFAAGGAERMDSVLAGIAALREAGAGLDEPVLVHDAARPCLRAEAVERLLVEAATPHGGLLALPLHDTVKHADADGTSVDRTLDRGRLWRAQTPQVFPLDALERALQRAQAEGLPCSDEAQAMERAGYRPRLVRGDATNLKITTPDDWPLAEFLLGRDA